MGTIDYRFADGATATLFERASDAVRFGAWADAAVQYESVLARLDTQAHTAPEFVDTYLHLHADLALIQTDGLGRPALGSQTAEHGLRQADGGHCELRLRDARAHALGRLGRTFEAISEYARAAEQARRDGADPSAQVRRLCAVAFLCSRLGWIELGERVLDEADQIRVIADDFARILHTRGQLAPDGDPVGPGLLERALELIPHGPDYGARSATVQADLAHALSHLDPAAAIPWYERALSSNALEGVLRASAERGLLALELQLELIEEREAMRRLQDLLARYRQLDDPWGAAVTLQDIATQLANQNLRGARDAIDQCVDLCEELGLDPLIDALLTRFELQARAGSEPDTTDVERACGLIDRRLSELRQSREFSTVPLGRWSRAFTWLALTRGGSDGASPDELIGPLERVRAIGLRSLIDENLWRAGAPAELLADENVAAADLERAQHEVVPNAQRIAAAERRLAASRERIRTAFLSAYPEPASEQPTMERLRATVLADARWALLYFAVVDDQVLSLCLTNEGEWASGFLVEDLQQVVDASATALSEGGIPSALLHELHEALIAQHTEIIGDRGLIIVPDGPLHRLPFGALLRAPNEAADRMVFDEISRRRETAATDSVPISHFVEAAIAVGQRGEVDVRSLPWLVRERPVRVVPSVAALLAEVEARPEAHPPRLVVVGDPDGGAAEPRLDPDDILRAQAGPSRAQRVPLPHARQEAKEIAELFARQVDSAEVDEPLLGEQATLDAVEQRLARPARFVHFACHALLDPTRPWNSAVALHDGPLTAGRILRRRLEIDHVTLNCCSTGLGRIVDGDGVLGLPRAFLAAGVRSLCVTLWPVVDETGPPFMRRYYSELFDGQPPHEALRRAQLDQIERGVPVYAWAGHIAIG